jgi:hypothetical protein
MSTSQIYLYHIFIIPVNLIFLVFSLPIQVSLCPASATITHRHPSGKEE